jgi:aldoxime dehydratase
MPKKQMPENWEPPVPAWQAEFDAAVTEVVFAYFGAQRPEGSQPGTFIEWTLDALKRSETPGFLTRATYVDAANYRNDVLIAYWTSKASFDAWWQLSGLMEYWQDNDRTIGQEGAWREIFCVAPRRFETLYSSQQPTGCGALAKPLGCPVREHNYWGGMRDRIPDTSLADDGFETMIAQPWSRQLCGDTRSRRVSATVPDNLCLIRSGQDLRDCNAQELATYTDIVRPQLTAGMAYLRDNPVETGCLSVRLMDETALNGAQTAQSFGLAMFSSLDRLESWSKNHPTHLAIFKSFFEMVERHEGNLDLRLWHEVLILNQKGSICEYINCHPNTGMLPWFAT